MAKIKLHVGFDGKLVSQKLTTVGNARMYFTVPEGQRHAGKVQLKTEAQLIWDSKDLIQLAQACVQAANMLQGMPQIDVADIGPVILEDI